MKVESVLYFKWLVILYIIAIAVAVVRSQNPNCPSGATPVGPCDQNGICFSGNVCVSGTYCCPPGNTNTNTSNPPPGGGGGNGLCSDKATNCANYVSYCRDGRYIQCLLNNCQSTCGLCALAASRGRLNGARTSGNNAPQPQPPQNNVPQPPGASFTYESNVQPNEYRPPPGNNEFAINVPEGGAGAPWSNNNNNYAQPQQTNPNTFHVHFHFG